MDVCQSFFRRKTQEVSWNKEGASQPSPTFAKELTIFTANVFILV